MEATSKKISTSYGLYIGVALILITVLVYTFDISLYTKWWFGVIILIFTIGIACMAVSKSKKLSDTLFTFKNAFTSYFLTIIIGTFISLIFTYILFNVIDPEAAQTLTELTIESTREMMEGFGAPQDQINATLNEMQNQNNYSLINLLKGYAFQLILFIIIGLIVALIFREKEPTQN